MKIRKSRDVLLHDCEQPPVESPDTLLPAEVVAAAARLIPPATTNSDDTASQPKCDSTLLHETSINIELKPEGHTRSEYQPDVAHVPIFKRDHHVSWYRNWTSAGIALCILYNICIVLLLLMGYFKFTN